MTLLAPAIDYGALAQALIDRAAGQATTKTVSTTPTTTYGHGSGGLFSQAALERPIFSAMILPRTGLSSVLPARPSMFSNPLYGIFTGVTATTGSEPTGPCDDPPVAGLSKLCTQSSTFGRFSRMTRVFDIDRMGLLTDRGEHTDLQFMGNPFQTGTGAQAPTIPGAQDLNGVLNNEVSKALFELGVAWSRDFAKKIYVGNPTNNTAGGGYKEYRGLDLLINTGYRDAETQVACAAADSIVASFANANIATNAASLISNITSIWSRLKYIAINTGLDPVKWALVMRWSAFYQLTEVWPCAYLTYRCTNLATGNTAFVDSGEAIRLRDEMRGGGASASTENLINRVGQYLLIDGEKVPVIIDDGVEELGVGLGQFRSKMYFVPLTVLGNTPVTYFEYLNYDAPNGALAAARAMAPEGSYTTSDSGRFLWHKKPPANFCVQMLAKTEPRIILRTPFLAAVLTNIQYTPVAHERESFTDSTYFVDGGRTDRGGYGPSYYSPTSAG